MSNFCATEMTKNVKNRSIQNKSSPKEKFLIFLILIMLRKKSLLPWSTMAFPMPS
ncbi:hypothetical protein ARSQ2_02499 [Arsenophonus endosymbiont of Bemisia tabaci Q2]|nr:hypothetical protein ARSQ2_02499 [Arsenophonus endosymbiont of Bemisia tabaci Q2]